VRVRKTHANLQFASHDPWVRRLLIANVFVYFVQQMLPGFTDSFVFVPRLILFRPWTIITYMFLHAGSRTSSSTCWASISSAAGGGAARLEAVRAALLHQRHLGRAAFIPLRFVFGCPRRVGGGVRRDARLRHVLAAGPDPHLGIIPIEARWLVIITTAMSIYSGLGGSQGGVADFAHLGGYLGAWSSSGPSTRAPRGEVPGQHHWRAQGRQALQLEEGRCGARPRGESRRAEPHPRQDQREGAGQPHARRAVFLGNFVPPDDRPPTVQ